MTLAISRLTVVNTSPLQYLFQLDRLDLLKTLFGRIVVPPEVVTEIEIGRKDGILLPNLYSLDWLDVRDPVSRPVFPLIRDLGIGEIGVISLGRENPGSLVILDDYLARKTARLVGLRLTGTAGILIAGKRAGLVDNVTCLLDNLETLGFFLAPRHRTIILKEAGENPLG